MTCKRCKVTMTELKGHIFHKKRKWRCPQCQKIKMQKPKSKGDGRTRQQRYRKASESTPGVGGLLPILRINAFPLGMARPTQQLFRPHRPAGNSLTEADLWGVMLRFGLFG